MSDEPSLRSIDSKLGEVGMFMSNQKEINQSLSDAVREIAKAVTKSESMQVELNGVSARLSDQSHEIKDIEKRVSTNETQLAVNQTIIKQQQEMKSMFTKAFIGLGFAFIVAVASNVFMNKDNGDMQQAIIKLAEKNSSELNK